jgi:hypothetical protein
LRVCHCLHLTVHGSERSGGVAVAVANGIAARVGGGVGVDAVGALGLVRLVVAVVLQLHCCGVQRGRRGG